MTRQTVTLDAVAQTAAQVAGAFPTDVVELVAPGGPWGGAAGTACASVRTFRAVLAGGDIVIRVDEDPNGKALEVEGRVLDALSTAAVPPLAPAVLARGRVVVAVPGGDGGAGGHGDRAYLAYPWIHGRALDNASAAARARDVGGAFARLHASRVMDLFGRLQRERPLTLLEGFRRSVEELKGWMAARELDGLGQDLLTLALSDLQRALRPFCIAQDHLFLTARRRVLCHGRAAPTFVVVRTDAPPVPPPLCFVGFDGACLGDAADDLAQFALAAGLDENAEDAMLRAYVDGLDKEGRLDRRFIPRYFARRTLGMFAQPVSRLDAIARMKRGDVHVLGDPVLAIEEQSRLAYEELARAMNGLRDLGGRARPVGVAEVMAMGRLLAVEEMILADQVFRIAVTGQPYVGKTEVASRLAKRLKHRFYGSAALSRALALVERDLDREASSASLPPSPASASSAAAASRAPTAARGPREPHAPKVLVERLFARGFRLEPRIDPPFYTARLDGRDVTEELREGGPLQVRGAQLLDDEAVRHALRDELMKQSATEGVVVDGAYAPQLVGGRAHVFHLSADEGVRRARLFSHRPDVGSEEEASKLLKRLDDAVVAPPADALRVDVASRTAAAATLEILWHLLPPGRRPQEDLSGRAPL